MKSLSATKGLAGMSRGLLFALRSFSWEALQAYRYSSAAAAAGVYYTSSSSSGHNRTGQIAPQTVPGLTLGVNQALPAPTAPDRWADMHAVSALPACSMGAILAMQVPLCRQAVVPLSPHLVSPARNRAHQMSCCACLTAVFSD